MALTVVGSPINTHRENPNAHRNSKAGIKSALIPVSPKVERDDYDDDEEEAVASEHLLSSSALDPSRKRPRSDNMVRVSTADEPGHREEVRRTRIIYDSLRSFIASQEMRLPAGRRRRADLVAGSSMKRRNLWHHRDHRIIGAIPGVRIGDVFFYRTELMALAIHGVSQGGIDYVLSREYDGQVLIATSIVLSGGYEDNEDLGDVIVYAGSGGRVKNAVSHTAPQRLLGGNLALDNSRQYHIEVRVVRGLLLDRSPSGRVYVYDGLYRVVDSWPDPGKSGFGVYKFKLVRIPGQEQKGSAVLQMAEILKTKILKSMPEGYLSKDLSNGRETLPVSVLNDIDDDKEPLLFEYCTKPDFPSLVFEKTLEVKRNRGCRCVNNCSFKCACVSRNGGELAYDGNGILLRGKPLIYECRTSCRCSVSCPNRVSQKGVRHRLEVFRSRETGWGVRSLDLIRAGEFICEISGRVLTREQWTDSSNMAGDNLLYPCLFPLKWAQWGDISKVDEDYTIPQVPSLPELSFAVDVSKKRNVGCYLSHCSRPNAFVQLVLHDHYNECYPHLMVFAMENIPPLRELSIDYGV